MLPQERHERRRVVTVIAVAFGAVLCVGGLVLAVKGLTAPAAPGPDTGARPAPAGSGPTATGSGSTPTGSSPGTSSAPPAADTIAFSSPSGNIGCTLSSAGARCDIHDRTWKPSAKPATCEADWGRGVAVTARGAALTCADNSVLGAKDELAYGRTQRRGVFSCTSSKDGMRCAGSTDGHGFAVARADYRTF